MSAPLESYTYEESGKYFAVIAGAPIMTYSCGGLPITLSGAAAGTLAVSVNVSGTISEAGFSEGVGAQRLELLGTQGVSSEATLATNITMTDAQATELRAKE